MFERNLDNNEIELINQMEEFIRVNHSSLEGHDHSHVLEVTRLAIEIGSKIKAPVDPFIVISGALFHDIGRVASPEGGLHGLLGASITEEYLEAVKVDKEKIAKITRIVTRHTPTSMIPPETDAEKVVFDADRIEVLGRIGILRGAMNKRGTIEEVLEFVIRKRTKSYKVLCYDESKEIAKVIYQETLEFLDGLKKDLNMRCRHIENLNLTKDLLASNPNSKERSDPMGVSNG